MVYSCSYNHSTLSATNLQHFCNIHDLLSRLSDRSTSLRFYSVNLFPTSKVYCWHPCAETQQQSIHTLESNKSQLDTRQITNCNSINSTIIINYVLHKWESNFYLYFTVMLTRIGDQSKEMMSVLLWIFN